MARAVLVTDETFPAEVLESPIPVLVDFWASWCPPCKAVEPLLEDLAQAYAGRAKVAKLQVDQNRAVASQFDVQGVPTFIVFRNGKPLDKKVGAQGPRPLREMIESAFGSDAS